MSSDDFYAGPGESEKAEEEIEELISTGESDVESIAEGFNHLIESNDRLKEVLGKATDLDYHIGRELEDLGSRVSSLGNNPRNNQLNAIEEETADVKDKIGSMGDAIDEAEAELRSMIEEINRLSSRKESLEGYEHEIEAIEKKLEEISG